MNFPATFISIVKSPQNGQKKAVVDFVYDLTFTFALKAFTSSLGAPFLLLLLDNVQQDTTHALQRAYSSYVFRVHSNMPFIFSLSFYFSHLRSFSVSLSALHKYFLHLNAPIYKRWFIARNCILFLSFKLFSSFCTIFVA